MLSIFIPVASVQNKNVFCSVCLKFSSKITRYTVGFYIKISTNYSDYETKIKLLQFIGFVYNVGKTFTVQERKQFSRI